jgi:ribonuclease P protein subunit RPR2
MKAKGRGSRTRSKKPGWQQEIAEERIGILTGLAERESAEHPERSERYAELAKKIGMRYNVKIPGELRRSCKGCHAFLVPGRNCIVRMNARTLSVEVKCMKCGKVSRHPYAKERMKC